MLRREGIGQVEAFAFVDTNVLLHYQLFDQVDWPAQLGVTRATLVFAPVVLAELDRQKWSGSRREKSRAKSVLKKIGALGLSPTPVRIRDGVHAVALDAEPLDALFIDHRLHTQASDDRLLASLIGFRDEHPGSRVLILSADSGLSVKARSRRIDIVTPADDLELPEEPDDLERELERARRELIELKNASPDLMLTFGGGNTHRAFTMRPVVDFDHETLDLLLDGWRSKHPHITPIPDSVEWLSGEVISLSALQGLPGFVTAADAARHNAAIDGYRAQYEMFLKLWPAAINHQRRILRFDVALENMGSAPAEDVEVHLSTEAVGRWLRKLPKLPRIPTVPRPRGLFDTALGGYVAHLDPLALANLNHPAVNENGPDISDDGTQPQVRYTVKRAKHHVPCELPVVYFQFESDATARSFTIDVRLFAANIREPTTGALHVQVTREAPAAPPLPAEADDQDE
jgi:hypothetical protein